MPLWYYIFKVERLLDRTLTNNEILLIEQMYQQDLTIEQMVDSFRERRSKNGPH